MRKTAVWKADVAPLSNQQKRQFFFLTGIDSAVFLFFFYDHLSVVDLGKGSGSALFWVKKEITDGRKVLAQGLDPPMTDAIFFCPRIECLPDMMYIQE